MSFEIHFPNSTIPETTYTPGSGTWETGHTIVWDTDTGNGTHYCLGYGNGKRDTLSSGLRNTYTLELCYLVIEV